MLTLTLTLKNFRKFTEAEFKFDQLLSLISGKSGQGKTTIYMAIMIRFVTPRGYKFQSYLWSCGAEPRPATLPSSARPAAEPLGRSVPPVAIAPERDQTLL